MGDTGTYVVSLYVQNDIGCFDEAIKSIFIKDDVVLYIPTAFSPNSDIINDAFAPYVRGMEYYDIMVYNRWGEVLWKSTDTEKAWDGNANGSRATMGFYFYRITGVDMNGKEVEKKREVQPHLLKSLSGNRQLLYRITLVLSKTVEAIFKTSFIK